jgi:hypothetical protein
MAGESPSPLRPKIQCMDLGDPRGKRCHQGEALATGANGGEGEWPSRGYLSVFWSPHGNHETFRYPHEVPGLELSKSTNVLSHAAMAAMTR